MNYFSPTLFFLPLWTNNLYLNQSDFVSDISMSENVQEIFEEAQCINHILKEVWITGYISHKSLLMFMAGSVMSLLIPNVVLFLLHGILKPFSQGVVYFFLRCAPGYTGNPQLGQSCTPGSGNGGKTGKDYVL